MSFFPPNQQYTPFQPSKKLKPPKRLYTHETNKGEQNNKKNYQTQNFQGSPQHQFQPPPQKYFVQPHHQNKQRSPNQFEPTKEDLLKQTHQIQQSERDVQYNRINEDMQFNPNNEVQFNRNKMPLNPDNEIKFNIPNVRNNDVQYSPINEMNFGGNKVQFNPNNNNEVRFDNFFPNSLIQSQQSSNQFESPAPINRGFQRVNVSPPPPQGKKYFEFVPRSGNNFQGDRSSNQSPLPSFLGYPEEVIKEYGMGNKFFNPNGGDVLNKPEVKEEFSQPIYLNKRRIHDNFNKIDDLTGPQKQRQTPYRSVDDFFINKGLKQLFKTREHFKYQSNIPNFMINQYHTFYKLSDDKGISKVFKNLQIDIYKVINSGTGAPNVLKQVHYKPEVNLDFAKVWYSLPYHPNICSLKRVFRYNDNPSSGTGGNCYIFIYDYIFAGENMVNYYYKYHNLIEEDTCWRVIIQVINALQFLHSRNLPYKILDESKLILEPNKKHLVKLSSVGMFSILFPDETSVVNGMKDIELEKQTDFQMLGNVMINLCSGNRKASTQLGGVNNELVFKKISKNEGGGFSDRLVNFLRYLADPKIQKTFDQIWSFLAPKLYIELNYLYAFNETMQNEISKEIENGRLFKLIIKLNYVINRLQLFENQNQNFLICKLFFDFLYKNDEIDLSHIIESLNKLDSGVDEDILLKSKDEKIIIVASYKDCKKIFEQAFKVK